MPMGTIHSGGGRFGPLDPSLRSVWFDDEPAVRFVASAIRRGWRCKPAPEFDGSADNHSEKIRAFIKHRQQRNKERAALEQETGAPVVDEDADPDRQTVHTPWRDCVYRMCNSVFLDISNFLWAVNPVCGYIDIPYPPVTPELFCLRFGDGMSESHSGLAAGAATDGDASADDAGRAAVAFVEHMWMTNAIVVPVYVAEGHVVEFKDMDGAGDVMGEVDLGSKENEALYLRRDIPFAVTVVRAKKDEGSAAVHKAGDVCALFAIGPLIFREGDDEEEASKEGDEEEEGS
ncbi:hypothetical protein DFJ73DRAFT_874971 [Zopfochytrium polystomum]|nr:hypothetical protein DFJ73DRAFT_874971 [Zopfochytrium polystomum]